MRCWRGMPGPREAAGAGQHAARRPHGAPGCESVGLRAALHRGCRLHPSRHTLPPGLLRLSLRCRSHVCLPGLAGACLQEGLLIVAPHLAPPPPLRPRRGPARQHPGLGFDSKRLQLRAGARGRHRWAPRLPQRCGPPCSSPPLLQHPAQGMLAAGGGRRLLLAPHLWCTHALHCARCAPLPGNPDTHTPPPTPPLACPPTHPPTLQPCDR